MESNQNYLSCQPSTSRINGNKNNNDIEEDPAEFTGTEMEDEEDDEEFQPNETDSSSDVVMNRPNSQLEHSEQRHHQWNKKLAEFSNENISTSAALHRELRNLSFRNPGHRCTLPVPLRAKRTVVVSAQQPKISSEPSSDRRSMRKRALKRDESRSEAQTRTTKSKPRYNNKGRLVLPGRSEVDLCDCLNPKCNGCQYQCKKCGGNKCSYACRINRTTFIEHIDTLGGGRVNNPFF